MIPTTINNFIIYSFLIWGTNMSLNILGIIKIKFPNFKNYDLPIDGKKKFKGKRLIGDSTTLLGILICVIITIFIYYTTKNTIFMIIPTTVYLGHTIGSIIKRRFNKKGGEFMPFVDHGDYTITTGLIFFILGYINVYMALFNILITYMIHPLVCIVFFKLKLRENPY